MARERTPCKNPSLFSFNDLILQASPCVMKVDRFDTDVRVESIFVEENRAARKVGHVKSFLKNIVINIVRCFLQGNNMSFPCNFVSKASSFPRRGPGFQLKMLSPFLQR